jgi:uncharacterized protein YjbI with pentapeptide repeats
VTITDRDLSLASLGGADLRGTDLSFAGAYGLVVDVGGDD